MNPRRRALLAGAAGLALAPRARGRGAAVEVMPFSTLAAGAPLPGWLAVQAIAGRERHTRYSLVVDAGRTVLRAQADASTSAVARGTSIDLEATPLLEWRWKVTRLIDKADLATKAGDDFPARLYLAFDVPPASMSLGERMALGLARSLYGGHVPARALCYVWDGRAPAGTFAPNAYTDRVHMVVAESGAARLGHWVEHRRDAAADYRRAFGPDAPPPRVNAVVVSTDTDDTGAQAEAFYGDVRLRARGEGG